MFPNLNAELARRGLDKSSFARLIGVTDKTARNKLDGITEFTLPEIEATLDAFPKLSFDYLFAREQVSA